MIFAERGAGPVNRPQTQVATRPGPTTPRPAGASQVLNSSRMPAQLSLFARPYGGR